MEYSRFKDKFPNFEDRYQRGLELKSKYPNCIPIICERGKHTQLP